MNIIYLSSGLSDKKFSALLEEGKIRDLPQAQKYHSLLVSGLSENDGVRITAISAVPANRSWTKKTVFKRETEWTKRVKYIYEGFINYPFIRQYTLLKSAEKEIKKIYKKKNDIVIIADVLNQSISIAALKCGKKYGIPVIGIVTDVPGYTSGAVRVQKKGIKTRILELADKIGQNNLSKYDGYLLLTEAMNEVVNKQDKPYIVIEGHSDKNMVSVNNEIENKEEPKVIMYAGGLHREYGIEMLTKAFLKGNFEGYKLVIYGDGNYKDELIELSEGNENLEFLGLRPNAEIVKRQLSATLLVNPRPTHQEFVKYSFPSKTMECMASGTPLLTTRLPGMPKEYYDYVKFIDEETEDGILSALSETLTLTEEELFSFGKAAKEFVMKEKTNDVQAKKLLKFIKENY